MRPIHSLFEKVYLADRWIVNPSAGAMASQRAGCRRDRMGQLIGVSSARDSAAAVVFHRRSASNVAKWIFVLIARQLSGCPAWPTLHAQGSTWSADVLQLYAVAAVPPDAKAWLGATAGSGPID